MAKWTHETTERAKQLLNGPAPKSHDEALSRMCETELTLAYAISEIERLTKENAQLREAADLADSVSQHLLDSSISVEDVK